MARMRPLRPAALLTWCGWPDRSRSSASKSSTPNNYFPEIRRRAQMPAQPNPHPKMTGKQPKRLLALDGGGIRGMISLEMLERIEQILKQEAGGGDEFRLADYFDYVGGTSTGAIIATCVSLGMSVAEIKRFYHERSEERRVGKE